MGTKSVPKKLPRILLVIAVIATAPLWLALLLIAVLAHLVQEAALYAIVWLWWIGPGNRRVLFVYSDSPNWKDHIEHFVIPRLPPDTVVLNWSNRRQWQWFGFPVRLFRYFAGRREFNPIGLVFERFHVVSRYRFRQPFHEMKHGLPDALQRLEERFFKHACSDKRRQQPL
jgi:hypothetical protein